MNSLLQAVLSVDEAELEQLMGWLREASSDPEILNEETVSRISKLALINVRNATASLSKDISWVNLLTATQLSDDAKELEDNSVLFLYAYSVVMIMSALLRKEEEDEETRRYG